MKGSGSFFEKKNQKTFATLGHWRSTSTVQKTQGVLRP
jgi:hypothetical protein